VRVTETACCPATAPRRMITEEQFHAADKI